MSGSRTEREWRWVLGGLLFVVLAPAANEVARRAPDGERVWWVVAGVLCTGLAFAIPQLRQVVASRAEATAEEREVEARVETRVAMNDALDPILSLIGALALERDPQQRELHRAKVVPLLLKTASEFIGPDRARACWFRLQAGPPPRLLPEDFAGRAGSPTTSFVQGTPSGDAAIEMVLTDSDLLCEDVATAPPLGWDLGKSRDYDTFVAVSVIAGDTGYGMLTLDASPAGALDADDLGLLRLMAGVLAVALSIGADDPPGPGVVP